MLSTAWKLPLGSTAVGGTAAAAPLPFRPSDPALCGSRPLVTPYLCRLGDLLCFLFIVWLLSVWFVCVLYVPSVLWYCWLGLLTCKNRLPYNLYCVGGDVKHCTIQSTAVSSISFDCPAVKTAVLWLWNLLCLQCDVQSCKLSFFY